MIRILALLLLCLLALPAQATWVSGTGHAVIRDGDEQDARERAQQDALRNAAMQFETHVASEDTVENGVLTDTRLTVVSRANVQDIRNLEFSRSGQQIRARLEARMSLSNEPDCGDQRRNAFRKKVGIAGFQIVDPDQGGIGRLEGLERRLPERLAGQLAGSQYLQTYQATDLQLYSDHRNAPTSRESVNRNQLSRSIDIAEEMGVQFIVSGVIRDISVSEPDTWNRSVLNDMRRRLGRLDRDRRFVVDLFIHDGFSGSPLLQKRFETHGEWDQGPDHRTGFATAAFDQTPYGQNVNELIAQMADHISHSVACQPFMAEVQRVRNDQIRIGAGASSGLRPGDTLKVYRRERFLELPDHMPELQDSHVEMTVERVHPDFASGTLDIEGARANVQQGDMVIAW